MALVDCNKYTMRQGARLTSCFEGVKIVEEVPFCLVLRRRPLDTEHGVYP